MASFVLDGATPLFAMRGATIPAVTLLAGDREIERIANRGTPIQRAALLPRWSMGFDAAREVIHRWACWLAVLTPIMGGLGILLIGAVVDDRRLWAVEHHFARPVRSDGRASYPIGTSCRATATPTPTRSRASRLWPRPFKRASGSSAI
ncbi:MAG: hypothetical protein AAGI51_09130 [Pseudomonadota bacterium]